MINAGPGNKIFVSIPADFKKPRHRHFKKNIIGYRLLRAGRTLIFKIKFVLSGELVSLCPIFREFVFIRNKG